MEKFKSPVRMSMRLHKVADMITPGLTVADIGTDHGYIPIYQVLTGGSDYAYACDVAEGPLGRAKDNVSLYNVGDRVQTVLSDGLKGLIGITQHKPESIVIAGMGGTLICRILNEGAVVAEQAKELVLSPHSEWYEVRCFLMDKGYEIIDEDMLKEDGKYYVIIKAVPVCRTDSDIHNVDYDEDELHYGAALIKKKHPVLVEFIHKELDTCSKIKHNLIENCGSTSLEKLAVFEDKENSLMRVLDRIMEV